MRILVTGGAGFIGSHLSARLLGNGHEIAILDDLNDYYSPEFKRRNLACVQAAGACRFVEGDICDAALVDSLADEFRPEAIVHLAARAGVRPSLEQPLLYERVNVGGTAVLLEAARRVGCAKFILASSSSIYGVANRIPFSEEDTSNLPISPYAATKLAAEKYCYTYSHLYGIQTVCLRFFTVYGPRQRPDLAIRKFMERMEAGQPIPLFGDGSMGRDYTFIEDIIDGVVASLGLETPYDVINLGNSSPVGLLDMVRTIEGALGKQARIEWKPDQPGDVPITFADISKAKRLLGYAPATPFARGIERQVAWMRSQ
ncbi:MAG: epimerase [Verrucomicrobia bacterium GWF2_62_7]|nr:MAG: epimerase [Verrucomicrobia bacterium GWF2_62_7]